jgi:hypothetical protein
MIVGDRYDRDVYRRLRLFGATAADRSAKLMVNAVLAVAWIPFTFASRLYPQWRRSLSHGSTGESEPTSPENRAKVRHGTPSNKQAAVGASSTRDQPAPPVD